MPGYIARFRQTSGSTELLIIPVVNLAPIISCHQVIEECSGIVAAKLADEESAQRWIAGLPGEDRQNRELYTIAPYKCLPEGEFAVYEFENGFVIRKELDSTDRALVFIGVKMTEALAQRTLHICNDETVTGRILQSCTDMDRDRIDGYEFVALFEPGQRIILRGVSNASSSILYLIFTYINGEIEKYVVEESEFRAFLNFELLKKDNLPEDTKPL